MRFLSELHNFTGLFHTPACRNSPQASVLNSLIESLLLLCYNVPNSAAVHLLYRSSVRFCEQPMECAGSYASTSKTFWREEVWNTGITKKC